MLRTLDDITLSDGDRQAVDAAARLLRQRFDAEQVILFGSKARGAAAADSDIDLLVLTKARLDATRRQALVDALFDVEMRFGVVISSMVVSIDDWRHGTYQVLPIRTEIDRDGVAA